MTAYGGKMGYGAIENNYEDAQFPSAPDINPQQRRLGIMKSRWFRYLGIGAGCIAMLIVILSSTWWTRSLEPKAIHRRQLIYDYIIVGGGPSGIITATKLARKLGDKRILLIEAGDTSQSSVLSRLQESKTCEGIDWINGESGLNQFDIPLLWSGAASSGGIDDMFQESSHSHHWPMSSILLPKGIGGSGLVNAMIYVRCLPEDIQNWNLSGWTWDTVQKHYYDLETYKDWRTPNIYKNETSQASWRGKSGPVVTTPSGLAMDSIAPLFLKSTLARGWPLASRGFNDPSRRVGASYYDFNIHDGIRHSIAEALLGEWNAQKSSLNNLDIAAGATAQKVLFDSSGQIQTATGVKYIDFSGRVQHAYLRDSRGEVILAAGSILTPQLLSNSGIFEGGKISNLSGVGKNLHDHPVVNMVFELDPEIIKEAPSIYTAGSDLEKYLAAVEELRQARYNDTGDKSINDIIQSLGTFATSGFSAGAFLKSPWVKDKVPDIQITVFPRLQEPHVLQNFKQNIPLAKKFLNMRIQSTCMLVTVALLKPEARYEVVPNVTNSSQSHGNLEIKPLSASEEHNFFNLPSIALPVGKASYLTEHDVRRIAWGMEEVRAIFGMSPISQSIIDEIYPGEKVTDELLLDHVKANRLTNSHWVGTAKMGRTDDPLAVVDEKLRVYGVSGLRVVDASVIPHIPNGNTHSTVSVVASLATDFILERRMKKIS